MPTAETQAIPEAVLEVVEPDGTRRAVRVTHTPFAIGRGAGAGNDLQLPDELRRISRECALVLYTDGVFRLQDRGQRHGLFVNGEQIQLRDLGDGDIITFGGDDSFQLIFRTGQLQESLPELLTRLERAATMEPGARDLRQLSLLLEATALLQSPLSLEEVLSAMLDRAIASTNADRGLLLEAHGKGSLRPMLARKAGRRSLPAEAFKPSQTAIAQAVEQQRSIIEEDVSQAQAALRDAVSIVAQNLRSVIAIPLSSLSRPRSTEATFVGGAGDLLAVLYLDSRLPAAFSRLDRQILDALSREVAGVLDNARLVQKEQERRRLVQELDIAREIQQALLPKGFRSFPHLEITGVNQSCLAVGGDYFDLMELSRDRTGFVIADVSGKGLGAALVTSMLQGTLSAMTLGQQPDSVFNHVNRFICQHSQVERYATLFFGILDRSGQLEFINAGHLTPLRIHDGRAEFAFPSECLPVGLFPDAEFRTSSGALTPGDTLVLYTDGVNEATNLQDEMFDLERLQQVVARHATASVEELRAAILGAVEEFTRGTYLDDDLTLLIIRYQGHP